jgi:hypothetical protein
MTIVKLGVTDIASKQFALSTNRVLLSCIMLLSMLVAASIGSAAKAATKHFTIDATLTDGATVTGFFMYNPDKGFQDLTRYRIKVSAAGPGHLSSQNGHLPNSIFFPFVFTPSNSIGDGPISSHTNAFSFSSDATFVDPLYPTLNENLFLSFIPNPVLTDTSSLAITNSNMKINKWSGECFDCSPWVNFTRPPAPAVVGAARSGGGLLSAVPEPRTWLTMSLGLAALGGALRRRRQSIGSLA